MSHHYFLSTYPHTRERRPACRDLNVEAAAQMRFYLEINFTLVTGVRGMVWFWTAIRWWLQALAVDPSTGPAKYTCLQSDGSLLAACGWVFNLCGADFGCLG